MTYKRGDMSETNITIRDETCNVDKGCHMFKESETCQVERVKGVKLDMKRI